MFGRYDILREIEQLDPETDYERIVYLVGCYEYPWLIKKSLEFALFRTYAVPHTSRILVATGQLGQHGQKRYDDTSLMLAGIAEHGIESEFAQTVIATMNRLHGRWNLRNEDMLYVLSTFIFEPIRWHKTYGWRNPTRNENLANYYFWYDIGTRMGITDIPDTIEAFEAFNIAHEEKYFAYDNANRQIGVATMEIFLRWYPAILRPIVKQVLLAFMDEPLRMAMGFEKPHAIFRWGAHWGLKALGFALKFAPPRRTPYLYTELPNRTYPQGFTPEQLGAKTDTPHAVS